MQALPAPVLWCGAAALLACLIASGAVRAAEITIITDRDAFLAEYPVSGEHPLSSLETLESADLGATTPIQLDGFVLRDEPESHGSIVRNELVNLPQSAFFGGKGSPVQFLDVFLNKLRFDLDSDAVAFGFDLACFACDPEGQPSTYTFTLYDAYGTPIEIASPEIQTDPASGQFLGLKSNVAFRSVTVVRSGSKDWLIDDVRFGRDTLFGDGFEE